MRVRPLAALCAVLAVALTACSGGNKKPKTRLAYEERPVELLYSTGADRMDKHLWAQAVDYFQEVERQHPYSEWSRRSILMQAFAHYQANNYAEAVADADRFISLYPGNANTVYAYYLKSICYFEQIVDGLAGGHHELGRSESADQLDDRGRGDGRGGWLILYGRHHGPPASCGASRRPARRA